MTIANPENYLTQAAADARYQALGGLGDDTPSQIDAGDTGSGGVSVNPSREDHQHPLPAGGTPVSIGLTGVNAPSATTELARIQHVHAYTPPACGLKDSTTNSPDDTTTVLLWTTESFDTDTMHSGVSNTGRITFNTAGVYSICGNVALPTDGDGYRWTGIRLNGTTMLAEDSKNGGAVVTNVGHSMAVHYKATAGDYVELLVRQTTGAGQVPNTSNFSAVWVGVG